nr:MAG TPA: hypothetical protein [Caudoviricetes sp.]
MFRVHEGDLTIFKTHINFIGEHYDDTGCFPDQGRC